MLWLLVSWVASAGPMTVAELNASTGLKSAQVYGSVVKVYTCPPCPDGAQCKPCMGDNFVLSDRPRLIGDWTLSPTEVVVYADAPHPHLGSLVVADLSLRDGPAPHGAPIQVELAATLRIYTAVELVHSMPARFPAVADADDAHCEVLVDLDPDGKPAAIEVLGCDEPFQEAVREAVTNWRWKGSGVAAYTQLAMDFKRV